MVSVRSIILNNNSTFYDYRTGGRIRIWPRITIFVAISPVFAFVVSKNLTDFVNSINTVASILLGFGFSVLFYIASTKEDNVPENSSLEKKNRIERINTLSKELFGNVSYFVMTSSAALAVAMLVIAPETFTDWLSKEALPYLATYVAKIDIYFAWLQLAIRSLFFFLILEASFTFARIVGRVNFLFEEKLKD